VLIDSEPVWASVREELAREEGGRWRPGASEEMMGMSSTEWSRFMSESLNLPMEPAEISQAVVARIERRYRDRLPLLPGAREAVHEAAERWPVGLASSSNRPLIDLVLDLAGLREAFRATVSSEEVGRGKPAPDVFLEAARRLEADPAGSAAIEDSPNGVRAASAAGMRIVAVPRPDMPLPSELAGLAEVELDSLAGLAAALQSLG
jgi:HAD superfamily hydrolase (TIGR01509 family)